MAQVYNAYTAPALTAHHASRAPGVTTVSLIPEGVSGAPSKQDTAVRYLRVPQNVGERSNTSRDYERFLAAYIGVCAAYPPSPLNPDDKDEYLDISYPGTRDFVSRWINVDLTLQNLVYDLVSVPRTVTNRPLDGSALTTLDELMGVWTSIISYAPEGTAINTVSEHIYNGEFGPYEAALQALVENMNQLSIKFADQVHFPSFRLTIESVKSLRFTLPIRDNEDIPLMAAFHMYAGIKNIVAVNMRDGSFPPPYDSIRRRGKNIEAVGMISGKSHNYISGLLKPSDRGIDLINVAWRQSPLVREIILKTAIVHTRAGYGTTGRVYQSILELAKNSGMASYGIICSFIALHPWIVHYPALQGELQHFEDSCRAINCVDAVIRPYYKLIHLEGVRLFDRKQLRRLLGLAVDILSRDDPNIGSFIHETNVRLNEDFDACKEKYDSTGWAGVGPMTEEYQRRLKQAREQMEVERAIKAMKEEGDDESNGVGGAWEAFNL